MHGQKNITLCCYILRPIRTHNDELPMHLYKQVYALFATGMANITVNDIVHGKIKL